MPRLSRDTWESIRAERESGVSISDLARKYGVNKAAISRRARREGWSDGRDVQEEIRRRATEKINEISTVDPAKKLAAIDAAAERIAQIIKRHQEETMAARERLYAGLKAHRDAKTLAEKRMAYEDLKAAKIAIDAIEQMQRVDRRNYGIDNNAQTEIIIKNPRRYDDGSDNG